MAPTRYAPPGGSYRPRPSDEGGPDGRPPGPLPQIKENLEEEGLQVTVGQFTRAIRGMCYSQALESVLIAKVGSLVALESTNVPEGSRLVPFSKAMWFILCSYDDQWDTIVSHLHRPNYEPGQQLYLSRPAGFYTEQAAPAGRVVLPQEYGSRRASRRQSRDMTGMPQL